MDFEYTYFLYRYVINLNFNNQKIIPAITNKLLKIFNAYMFVGNFYRICLINILKFTL